MEITIVSGNLGGDSDLKYLEKGTAVLNFSVAASRKDKSGEKLTVWYNCSMFGKRAEALVALLRKGASVIVRGTLRVDDEGRIPVYKDKAQLGLMVDDVDITKYAADSGDDAPASKSVDKAGIPF